MKHRSLWLSGTAALALFVAMQLMLAGLKPNVVALQFSCTPAAFAQVLAAWQEAGVASYRSHFPLDFAFLLSYGAFGHLLATTTGLFSRLGTKAELLAGWLAPAAALCDAGENVLHLALLSSAAAISPMVVALAAIFSALKWMLLAGFIALLGSAQVRSGR